VGFRTRNAEPGLNRDRAAGGTVRADEAFSPRKPGQEHEMEKSTIPHNALVMVGDGARAVFLRNSGTIMNPSLAVEDVFQQTNPPNREQGTDKPPRAAPRGPRNSIEPTDWHQLAEDRFAREIADKLYALAHRRRFQCLLIVAPPRLLGQLRKSMHKEVTDRIEAEIPKEWAAVSVHAIQKELASWHP
jgi:protein required for attachment to host cells